MSGQPASPDPEVGTHSPGSATSPSQLWLSLLRDLDREAASWCVMKGVESALTALGDVDSIADLEDWPTIVTVFRRWAARSGLSPVIVCPHAPYLMHLVALSPTRSTFYELDVNRRKIFLGSTLFRPTDVRPLVMNDARGFRKLRPGAEGVLRLTHNGMRRDGTPNVEGLRQKNVVALLKEDLDGVDQAAELFGRAGPAARRLARRAAQGSWSRPAALALQGWCVACGVKEPDATLARVTFRVNKRRCPVLRAVFDHQRQVPGDVSDWLAEVAMDHDVYPSAT